MSKAPYLGLDIGLRRTGAALSETGLLAQPLTVIEWQPPHRHALIAGITKLVEEHGIQTVVAGLPLSEEGATPQSERTEVILTDLHTALDPAGVEIVTVDESYSTVDALAHYPNIDKDAAAAAIILQNFLDAQS